jgi:hypothetical protein
MTRISFICFDGMAPAPCGKTLVLQRTDNLRLVLTKACSWQGLWKCVRGRRGDEWLDWTADLMDYGCYLGSSRTRLLDNCRLTGARMTWPCSLCCQLWVVLELHIKITLGAIRSTQFITSPTTHLNACIFQVLF